MKNGSALAALPFLFVLSLGLFCEGGDWPPATFLIRVTPFLLAALFLLRHDEVTVRPTLVDLLAIILWLLAAASLFGADYGWVSSQWVLHYAAILLLYGLLRGFPDPRGRLPEAAGRLILAAAAVEVAIAAFQKLALGEFRLTGTLQNPSFLAEVLVYGGIAAWYGMRRRDAGPAPARLLAPLILLFLAGVWLARSRGGTLLALVAGGYLAAERFGWKRPLAGLALLAAGFFLIPNPFLDRFLGKGDPYAFERLNMWEASLRIFRDHPMGVGLGHFKYFWPAVRDPVEGTLIRYAKSALTPHNEFFSVLSELGFLGAAVFSALGFSVFVSLRRAFRSQDALAAGAALILFVSSLHALVQSNYHVIGILLVNAAALAVVSGRLWRPVFERKIRVKGPVRWTALALLLAMTGYAGMTLAGTLFAARGRAALEAGRWEEAVRRFLQAAAADPWRAAYPDSASAACVRLHTSSGEVARLAQAIDCETEALLRNPLESLYPARLGFLLARAAERDRGPEKGRLLGTALGFTDKALMLNPHGAEIQYQKASLLRAAGRPDDARRQIEAALAEEPRFVRGWVFLGAILERQDRGKALEAYERALALHERHRDAASGADETKFLSLDADAVRGRIRELRGRTGG